MKKSIFIFSMMLLCIPSASAINWWNVDYNYRIDQTLASGQRPLILPINIIAGTGTNNASTIFCNNHCQSDFDDIRFILDDYLELPYYLEYTNGTTDAKFWVNVTSNGSLSIYYGYSGATYTGNGSTAFSFIDVFSNTTINTSSWGGSTGSTSISSGILSLTGDPTVKVYSLQNFTTSTTLYTKSILSSNGSADINHFGLSNINETHFAYLYENYVPQNILFQKGGSSSIETASNITLDNWNYFTIRIRNGIDVSYLQNGISLQGSPISTYPPNTDTLKIQLSVRSAVAGIYMDYVMAYPSNNVTAWNTWGNQIMLFSNSITQDENIAPVVFPGSVTFYGNSSYGVCSFGSCPLWYINGVLTQQGSNSFNTYISQAETVSCYMKGYGGSRTITWSVTVGNGRLNITAVNESNYSQRINTFSVQIYNASSVILRNTTTGWINLTNTEIYSGEYLVRIPSPSGYQSRSILVTSPADVTIYLPSTALTLHTVSLNLLDYTSQFPWQTTILELSKNGSVMHSSYFDSDSKVSAVLIEGEPYSVTLTNGDNVRNWGNYVAVASGSVQIAVLELGFNKTQRFPFNSTLSMEDNVITYQWLDLSNYAESVTFTVYENSTLVHSYSTNLSYGSSSYTMTNNSLYRAYTSALTSSGYRNSSKVYDLRSSPDMIATPITTWSYGSVSVPTWAKSAIAIILLLLLAGSAGAMHRGEGGIVTAIMALVFYQWDWLNITPAVAIVIGGILLFAILYHMDSKTKGG